MPYKSEKIKLQGLQDRRRKLEDWQREEIKHKYATGLFSLNQLASEYHVSKKLILLIVNPESKRKSDERIKEHWKDYQKTGEEHNEVVREHRRYKQKLYKEGKLKE